MNTFPKWFNPRRPPTPVAEPHETIKKPIYVGRIVVDDSNYLNVKDIPAETEAIAAEYDFYPSGASAFFFYKFETVKNNRYDKELNRYKEYTIRKQAWDEFYQQWQVQHEERKKQRLLREYDRLVKQVKNMEKDLGLKKELET